MSRKRLLEKVDIDPKYLDLNNWPTVLIETLQPNDKEIFSRRKRAVEMYINDYLLDEIKQETGLNRRDVSRYIKRCLSYDDNGIIWGYRGLLPQKNLKPYQRKVNSSGESQTTKLTGAFQQLLDRYPTIKDSIYDYYLRKNKKSVTEPVVRTKHLHKRFIEACRTTGIKPYEYPLNTKDMARRSLYRYVKKLELENPKEASKRYGQKAELAFRNEVTGLKSTVYINRPFQRVEFDGHAIDVVLAIKFRNINGDEVIEIMERIWLLTIIDVATRVVLGYHICLNSQYSSSDVLECIRNTAVPHQPKNLTIPGLKLPDNGGYHSIAIPQTEWALWDEVSYDNGKANLASIVTSRLTEIVGCSVNPGPVNTPERRGIVERFFGLLESNGYQRLPNTTGSNPSDPKRRNPEKKAKQYEITFEEIEQLTEVLIANYNTEPHSALGYLSPLEVMDQRINQRDMLPRIKPEEERNEDEFLSFIAKRTIRGSLKSGKRPYITYEGVPYRNEVLSKSLNIIGQDLHLLVNINDLRVIRAYLSDGTEFGYLKATGKWGITPHTLRMRKQINQLIYRKMLFISQTDDPLECLYRFLEEEAEKKKKPRNQLENLRRYQQHLNEKEANEQKNKNQSMARQDEKHQLNNEVESKNELNSLRQRFKTITF
jgi:transposase InsO family protein